VSSRNAASQKPEIRLEPVTDKWAQPIVARLVSDDVVDRLVTAVGLGVYIAGQQLPTERELAAMLGVSRTSVRDALKQLTEQGYLEVRRGRTGGYFVLSDWGPASAQHVRRQLVAHWSEFEHVFDARTVFEQLIARTAATRRTAKDIAVLRDAVQAYVDAPDRDASRRADTAFHLAVAETTHNPVLVVMSTDLRARITLNLGAEPYSDEARRKAIGQHAELVTAIAEGRGDEAAEIAADHFAISEALIRRLADRAEHEPQGGADR
jgi:DNA-binding FadR family transcriptional regulator